ncbi:MAG: hypothetical protein Q8R98_11940, partial [Rubrivivax sp.]|nr:hypothetical protein [Rubrivivax sp.]
MALVSNAQSDPLVQQHADECAFTDTQRPAAKSDAVDGTLSRESGPAAAVRPINIESASEQVAPPDDWVSDPHRATSIEEEDWTVNGIGSGNSSDPDAPAILQDGTAIVAAEHLPPAGPSSDPRIAAAISAEQAQGMGRMDPQTGTDTSGPAAAPVSGLYRLADMTDMAVLAKAAYLDWPALSSALPTLGWVYLDHGSHDAVMGLGSDFVFSATRTVGDELQLAIAFRGSNDPSDFLHNI